MSAEDRDIVRVRVWDLVVRATHWAIALSIAGLSVTGYEIGHPVLAVPGSAGEHFVMGTVRVVHFYMAIVFTLAVLSRIAWLFIGHGYANWRQFVPAAKERRAAIIPSIKFYLFMRPGPPAGVGHNPLASSAYLVVFGLYLVMIVTGFGLYAVDATDSPMAWAKAFTTIFGGITWTRWIHHVVMWMLLGFVIHHIYSAILTSVVERNGTMESIFTGNKWVPRKLAEEDKGAK